MNKSAPYIKRIRVLWSVILCIAGMDGGSADADGTSNSLITQKTSYDTISSDTPASGLSSGNLDLPFMETSKTEKPDFIAARKLPNCMELTLPSQPLSLMEALHWALCHNPDTRVVWASALANDAQVGVSRSAYYPTTTLAENYSVSRSTSSSASQPVLAGIGNTSTIVDSGSTNPTYSTVIEGPALSINYLLYDFGGRAAMLDASKQTALASLFTYYSTVQQVVLNTIQSYYALQLAYASVDAAKQTLSFNQLAQKIADTKHALGLSPIADKLQADTATAQTELNIQNLEQQIALQQGTLARAMGIAPQTPLRLPEQAPILFSDNVADAKIEELVKQALKNRPDLLSAKACEQAAKAQIRSADAQDYPQINLSLTQDETLSQRPESYHENNSTALISVSFPLFTGFKNTYTREAAEHNYEAQAATLEQTQQNIELDVWNNYQNCRTARANIALVDKLVASASKNNEVALGRYKEGVGTILDALNAQSQLAAALLQQANAQYTLQIQRAKLAGAMGLLYQSVETSRIQ